MRRSRLNDINCWKQWYPKNQLPKDFSKIQNKGFRVKGSKKKIIICKGDSGSPAIWRNIKNKKDYVIGIAYESEDTNVCYDDPKNRKPADKYGAVPGVIFKWIREKGGKEVEEWLKNVEINTIFLIFLKNLFSINNDDHYCIICNHSKITKEYEW